MDNNRLPMTVACDNQSVVISVVIFKAAVALPVKNINVQPLC